MAGNVPRVFAFNNPDTDDAIALTSDMLPAIVGGYKIGVIEPRISITNMTGRKVLFAGIAEAHLCDGILEDGQTFTTNYTYGIYIYIVSRRLGKGGQHDIETLPDRHVFTDDTRNIRTFTRDG